MSRGIEMAATRLPAAPDGARRAPRRNEVLKGTGKVRPVRPLRLDGELLDPKRSRLAVDHPAVQAAPQDYVPCDRDDRRTHERMNHSASAPGAWSDSPAFRGSAQVHDEEFKACVALQAQYIFGRFPGTVPTVFIRNYVQAHHLDLDFYECFFKPGAYLRTHAEHMQRWHGRPEEG